MLRRVTAGLPALLAALLGLAMALHTVGASAQAVLTGDHNGAIEGSALRYFIDRHNALGGADRSALEAAPWRSPGPGAVSLGFVRHPVWFHLRIHNDSPRSVERYLQISNPALEVMALRSYQGGPSTPATASDLPAPAQPVTLRAFTRRLQLDPGATMDIYLQVASHTPLQLPVSLWQADKMLDASERSALLLGLYYGALLVMLVYNAVLYLHSRDARYSYYLVYLVSIGSFFVCINGIGGAYIWRNHPGLTHTVALSSLGLVAIFSSLFATRFLSLANTRPTLERAIQGVGLGTALSCLASILYPHPWSLGVAMIMAALMAAANLITGMVRWYDRHPSGLLFTLAWTCLTAGAMIMTASGLGWVERTPLTENMAQLGSMLEFMILSMAMIQRLNAERRARSAAQRNALDFERQASQARQAALEAQRSATEELEERVMQRTRELQRLNDQLQTLSTTDSLTGLRNRRFFMERLHAEFSRSKRDGTTIAIIVVDVDHFKAVNDTHGHLVGDELLRIVARQINAEVRRESDIVARQGGEEFAALLLNNNAAQALEVAERIRVRVAAARYQAQDISLSCTVSIGVAAMMPTLHSCAEELLKSADAAMYRSKSAGRDQVSVAGQAAA